MRDKINLLDITSWEVNNTPVYFSHVTGMQFLEILILFNAGSIFDGSKPGLSQLTNAMLNQGVKNKSASDIARDFECMGAELFTDADRDSAIIKLRTLIEPAYLEKSVKLFSRVLCQADFPQAAYTSLRKRYIGAIEMRALMPEAKIKDAFYGAMYGDHPYANPVMGTASNVKCIARKDIIDFYKKYYVANNAKIILFGGINKKIAKMLSNTILEHLPLGKESLPDNAILTNVNVTNRHITMSSSQAYLSIGGFGVGYHDPDYFPLMLACHILGGSHQARLFTLIRKKHAFSYDASASLTSLKLSSHFIILLQTKTDQLKNATDIIIALLKELQRHGPTKEEFLRAKAELVNRFPLSLSTSGGVGTYITQIATYNLPLDYFDSYQSNVAKVSLQQVHHIFKKYFTVEKLAVVSVSSEI